MSQQPLPTFDAVPDCANCDPAGGFCHVFQKSMPASHFERCRTNSTLRWRWAGQPGDPPNSPPEKRPNALLEKLRAKNGGPTTDAVPDCVCPLAGHCQQFDVEMSERSHEQCKTEPAFRWELAGGRGPKPKVSTPRVDAPCIHRGQKPIRTVRCKLCGKKDRFVQIFPCNNPAVAAGECATERYQVQHDPNFECCNGCGEREEGFLTIDYRDAAQEFRDAFYREAEWLPESPVWQEGRCVVVCGGWGRFFPSLYVTLSMIRRTGFDGPLQVWGLGSRGEIDPRAAELCEHLGVAWIDGEEVARDPFWAMKRLNGWELKALALAACEYREVALFDADSYPLSNPAAAFDDPRIAATGAYFTQDAFSKASKLDPKAYAAFGLPHDELPAWESGQMLVDKGRNWRPVRLALWLNSESARTYEAIYGDKDTFHFAWQKTQSKVCVSARPAWKKVGFVHWLPDGSIFAVHRCQAKFRVGDGHRFMTPQKGLRCDELPAEEVAFAYFEECLAKLAAIEGVVA